MAECLQWSGTLDSLSEADWVGGVGVRGGGIPGGRELVRTRRTHGLCPKPRAKKGSVCPSGRKRLARGSTESLGGRCHLSPHVWPCTALPQHGRPGWAWGSVGERTRGHARLSPSRSPQTVTALSAEWLYPGTKEIFKKKEKKQNTAQCGDFLGSPVVKTSAYDAGSESLIPGWETEIPHDSWPQKPKHKTEAKL